jgi:hypothetical protein
VIVGRDLEILEFRAENFQQLLAPPRRKEFDFLFELPVRIKS